MRVVFWRRKRCNWHIARVMFMGLSNLGRTGEVALIIAGGGLAAWYGPCLTFQHSWGVALLANFRGRASALTAAISTSVMALGFAFVSPHMAHPLVPFVVTIASMCLVPSFCRTGTGG